MSLWSYFKGPRGEKTAALLDAKPFDMPSPNNQILEIVNLGRGDATLERADWASAMAASGVGNADQLLQALSAVLKVTGPVRVEQLDTPLKSGFKVTIEGDAMVFEHEPNAAAINTEARRVL